MLHSFEAVIGKTPKVLILGSMPSMVSLERSEYYGFKHNRFWKVIAKTFQTPLFDYDAKLSCLTKHHIALWDVIQSCEREGSLDSKIKHVTCNDIEGLLTSYPSIMLIICNGKKSYDLFHQYFKHLAIESVCLPSTSNANRSISEDELFKQWMDLLKKECF